MIVNEFSFMPVTRNHNIRNAQVFISHNFSQKISSGWYLREVNFRFSQELLKKKKNYIKKAVKTRFPLNRLFIIFKQMILEIFIKYVYY